MNDTNKSAKMPPVYVWLLALAGLAGCFIGIPISDCTDLSKISRKWIREACGSARRGAGFQSAFDLRRGIAFRPRRGRSSAASARWDRALFRSETFAPLGT